MILDKENLFSEQQAVTATAVSDNVIDLGPGDAGESAYPFLTVHAAEAFTGGGTLAVELQTADDEAFTTPVTVAIFPVTAEALATTGQLVAAKLPKGMRQFVRLNYAVTGTLADGLITAGLAFDV